MPLAIHALTLDGEPISLSQSDFAGRVTLIQLLGTWCPNCLDESHYLNEIQERFGLDRVSVIGLAFEKSVEPSVNLRRIERYTEELNLMYPIYLAGKASKANASEAFPMLNGITSFPTTLMLDRQGDIHLIHTGFNGPGTGLVFDTFKKRFEDEINILLQASTAQAH
jgi:thiol-disulfide isomerase/thioredoxin